jgi:tetratricopeptide (TPR) repeat protein
MWMLIIRPNNTDVAACMTNLAVAHMNTGDIGPAPEALLKRALHVYEQQETALSELEDEDVEGGNVLSKQLDACEPLCNIHTILGHLYYQRGEEDKAIASYREVEDIYKLGLVKDDSRCAPAMENLAMIMWNRGNRERAEELLREALFAKRFDAGSSAFLELERLLSALKSGQEKPPERGRDETKEEEKVAST